MRIALLAVFSSAFALVAATDQPARPSPPFTIQRTGAPQLPLSRYRGKIVALAFIHTTCPHCQDLTKTLNPIAREYSPKGVQFLECAFNVNAGALVPDFIKQFEPSFPVGWADSAAVQAYLQYTVLDNRPFYVPHMVFLDRRGIIRGDFPGESNFFQNPDVNIRAELDKILKAGGAPAAGRKK